MPPFATPLSIIATLAAVGLTALCATAGWGPGIHIQLTQELLRRFRRRKSLDADQALVLNHADAFLYGNIAADIINFKAFGGVKNHCHNWNIHERLNALASDDAARAFTLGYLCHLAADVIAHNHFVPYHLIFNLPPRVMGHAFWEAMADGRVSDPEWHAIDALKRNRSLHRFDHLVHVAVRRRALGLRSNRWIFNNILLLSCRKRWRELVRNVHESARRHPLDEVFHRRSRGESFRNMLSVFKPKRLALLKASDPTGRAAFQGVRRMRRELIRDFPVREAARDVSRELARSAYWIRR